MVWHGVRCAAGQGSAVCAAAQWAVSHRGTVRGGAVQCVSCGGVWCGMRWGGSVHGVWLPDGSCHVVARCGVRHVVGRGVACGRPTHCVASWRGVWRCGAVHVVRRCGAAHGVRPPDVSCHVMAWCVAVRCGARHGAVWRSVQPHADGLGTCKNRKKGRG